MKKVKSSPENEERARAGGLKRGQEVWSSWCRECDRESASKE
jgi:hypothetical protein